MSRNKSVIILAAVFMLAALLITGCGQSSTTTTAAAALSLATTSLPNASIGISYSQTMQASGGSSPYTWSITDGSLPGGFSLSSRTGSISGMPMNPGVYKITVQVSDSKGAVASRPLSITINAASVPLTAGTSFLTTGEEGVSYTQTLKAYGGSGTYSWEISGGSLPEDLALDGKTGVLSGKLKTAGKYIISTKITDSQGAIATESLTLTVNKRVNITTESLEFGEADVIYARRLEAADGVGNYVWSVSGGKLPEGLELTAKTGEISGTPKKSGNYDITVMATDSIGGIATRPFTLEVKPGVIMSTTTLPSGKVGTAYYAKLEFSGGNGEYIWGLQSGALPDGLTLDGNTGTISGTPKTAVASTFEIEIIDSYGSSDKKELTITIGP
jgi:major membrane immunogen (membrane-anchored lipoprotein)